MPFFDVVNLTYKGPRYNTFKWRVCYRPDRRRRRYSTFAPFPGYIPPQLTPAVGQSKDRRTRRFVGSRCRVWLMDDSHGFGMPHARCLRYWQPATKPTKLLELRRIIPANSLPRLGPAAARMRTMQQTTWALPTFTPATFSPACIHKPHAAQPDLLLLLLLCNLSSPLSGSTKIAVWRCWWWRV